MQSIDMRYARWEGLMISISNVEAALYNAQINHTFDIVSIISPYTVAIIAVVSSRFAKSVELYHNLPFNGIILNNVMNVMHDNNR
jgi:hypothetical protein